MFLNFYLPFAPDPLPKCKRSQPPRKNITLTSSNSLLTTTPTGSGQGSIGTRLLQNGSLLSNLHKDNTQEELEDGNDEGIIHSFSDSY